MGEPLESNDPATSEFDAYARDYSALHQASIRASGEDPDYFVDYKLGCLARLGARGPVLDFGCGTGTLTSRLTSRFDEVAACDPSLESLKQARVAAPSAHLTTDATTLEDGHFGCVILAGVLHHVPPGDRLATLRTVRSKLRPGGRVFVFEHNPLNPLTRRAVRDCPFDEDAVLLWPWEPPRLLREAGFENIRRDFIVFFPRPLAPLRPLEPKLRWLALGAQTLTVGERR